LSDYEYYYLLCSGARIFLAGSNDVDMERVESFAGGPKAAASRALKGIEEVGVNGLLLSLGSN
jgi:hypothetical protein